MSNELEKVNDTAEETPSCCGTYKFKKPTKIDGEVVTEINYDFASMNGASIRRAKSELQRKGYTVAVKELDECYHAALFAEASGLTLDNVESFHMSDYNAVADLARDFLIAEE